PAAEPSAKDPQHQPLPIEQEVQQTKSAASGHQDIASRQREHLATVQLEELKQKYERLEKLFQEKSSQFAQAENQLEGELKNREDFFKLKTILESEIHDVKDRARDLQNTLKNAQMETEQQKVQAQQLRDKVHTLEDEIQQKNTELEPHRTAAKDTAKPPPGLPLDKLIEQTRREEAEKKEGSPEENPVLNLPQDQKTDPHSPSSSDQQPAPPQESPSVPDEEPPQNPGPDPQSEDKRF
ncbi:MAG: hypothetical protein K8I00_11545, partial [Candidatus Omnitrophica bacterium]|nr:hypothetical protein [Candidatus Omnitrophota bacterium]